MLSAQRPLDHVHLPPHSRTTTSGMGKRKPRNKTLATTLTKIDPSILGLNPVAVSQHAARNGARVTTPVNPVIQPPPPVDPIVFDFDPESLDENPVAYDGQEDSTEGYCLPRVCVIARRYVPRLIATRTIHSCCGGMNAAYFSMNLSGSKAGECSQMAIVNSAATKARSVALIVLQFSSFARNACLVFMCSIRFMS